MFNINGHDYQVMVDTGATISCVPEYGSILKATNLRFSKANLVVKLATGKEEHINRKVKANIKPSNSNCQPQSITMYVQDESKHIFGFDALIGLKHIKLFDLNIKSSCGKILIYHQDQVIGCETSADTNLNAGVKVIDKTEICSYEPNNIKAILNRYKAVFTELDSTPMSGSPMRFMTVHQRPIFAKQRHYAVEEIKTMKQPVKELLDKGIIECTSSGYAAASRIIPKKNGSGRLVINYIPLNAVTYRDSYATPHITDIMGAIRGNKYFSTLDCTQGFYQIEVDWRDRHKTAFSTPVGNYQFRRCPFGARNSGAKFQSEMNRIFFDGLYTRCIVYVDDILIMGKTIEEHDANLDWVLNQALENHVKIKLEKCVFAKREVQYLGFLISGHEIKPINEKLDTFASMKAPRDKTELRSVIGKLNFYSRFIREYSTLLEPLRILLTKNKDYQWTQEHQQSYEAMISQLRKYSPQLLEAKNTMKHVILEIIDNSIEVVLTNVDGQLITRSSKLLSNIESNYSFVEKQLLALTYAIERFKLLLQPECFTVKVPNNDLEKTLKLVNKPDRVDRLLLRMPPGFDSFIFKISENTSTRYKSASKTHVPQEIFYIDGACKRNGKPDCKASWAVCAEYDRSLERTGLVEERPSNQSAELTAAIKACEIAKAKGFSEITIVTDSKYLFSAATLWIDKWRNNDWMDHRNKKVVNVDIFQHLLKAKEGLSIQWLHVKGHSDNAGNVRADNLARDMLSNNTGVINAFCTDASRLQSTRDIELNTLKDQIVSGQRSDLIVEDGIVYFIDDKLPEGNQHRLYVPDHSRQILLKLAHDDEMFGGHLGIKKTYRKLIKFWWPKMHAEIESYVKSCDICQKFKGPKGLPPGYLHSIPVSAAFDTIHIDIVGPLKTTLAGNKYVITATDALSKWVYARPSQCVRTSELISFVEDNILAIHGKPKRIISDRGTQFTSAEWKSFMDKQEIEHKLTSAYHPQSNGIDERVNGTLMRILRSYVNNLHENWDDQLKWCVYSYNTTVHESTGYSPYQILHGTSPKSPLNPDQLNSTSDFGRMKESRETIRRDAFERNKLSQEAQKLYYDKHRSQSKLYVGQSVYIKTNAAPTYLTKKFYPSWDGPLIIISLIGDKNNPRAVTVLDVENWNKKVVAVDQVKLAVDTYGASRSENQDKNGDSRTRDSSSCSWINYDPYYYSNSTPKVTEDISSTGTNQVPRKSPEVNLNGHPSNEELTAENISENLELVTEERDCRESFHKETDRNEKANDYTDFEVLRDVSIEDASDVRRSENIELDITRRHSNVPIASSPRRVRYSEIVQEFSYPPEQSIINNQGNTTDTDSNNNEASNIQEQETPLSNIDNVCKDPHYIPPRHVLLEEAKKADENTSSSCNRSLIPRYNLRSVKRKEIEEEQRSPLRKPALPEVTDRAIDSTRPHVAVKRRKYEEYNSSNSTNDKDYSRQAVLSSIEANALRLNTWMKKSLEAAFSSLSHIMDW